MLELFMFQGEVASYFLMAELTETHYIADVQQPNLAWNYCPMSSLPSFSSVPCTSRREGRALTNQISLVQ